MRPSRAVVLSVSTAVALAVTGCGAPSVTTPVEPTSGSLDAVLTPAPQASASTLAGLPPLADVAFYRGDALGGSFNPGPGPAGKPQLAWHTPYGASQVWPLLVDGLLIGGSVDGPAVGLDARTGEERWRFAPDGGIAQSIAAIDGLVFLDGPSTVYALDVRTGAQRWAAPVASPFRGVVVDGVVYVSSLGGAVGLSSTTGARVWQWQGPKDARSTAVRVADGVAYVSAGDGRIYAIELQSGAERWHVQTISLNPGAGEIVGDTVYAGTVQGDTTTDPVGELYAIDRATGRVRWTHRGPSNYQVSAGPVSDHVIFVGGQNDGISALRDDGTAATQVWHVDAPIAFLPLVLVGDTLYEQRDDGSVGAYATADGRLLWETPAVGTPGLGPLVSGGMVFTASDSQGIMAYADPSLIALIPKSAAMPSMPTPSPTAEPARDPFTVVKADPWTATTLAIPLGMDVGADGLIYILDTKPSVTVIDPRDWRVVRSWGRQGAAPGEFDLTRADDNPGYGDIAVGRSGRVYVADGSNHRIQVFGPDGTFVRQFGRFGTADGQFGELSAIAVDHDENVYVVDESLNALSKLTADGKFVWRIDPSNARGALVGPIHDPVIRPDGTLLATCEGCHGDLVLDAVSGAVLGRFVPSFDSPEFTGRFDTRGNLYGVVQDRPDVGEALVVDPNGRIIGFREGTGNDIGRTVNHRGSTFWPRIVFGPDGFAYSFNEDGLLQIKVTLPPR